MAAPEAHGPVLSLPKSALRPPTSGACHKHAGHSPTFDFSSMPSLVKTTTGDGSAPSQEKSLMLRSQTWTEVSSRMHRRSEAALLRPEAIARLHKLHEEFLQASSGQTPNREDTSSETLDASWGLKSWQLYGRCPRGTEKAMHVRDFMAVPSFDADLFLGRSGCGLAMINTKGRKGPMDTSRGQDNFSVSHLHNGWDVICVMDGHGKDGDWPATRAARTMPFYLQGHSGSQMLQNGQPEAALTYAFDRVQSDLIARARLEKIDLQASGCTAVCILWDQRSRTVCVGTAGDSRAVLFAPNLGLIAETEDHKPSVERECQRVLRSGGDVVRTEFEDGYVETRVNVKGHDYPGISMTRSLGDLSVKDCGVIAEPQVVRWKYTDEAFVLAASDGVWEFLDTEVVVNMICKNLEQGVSHKDILEKVLLAARDAWALHEDGYCDDITIVLSTLASARGVSTSMRLARGSQPCIEGIQRMAAGFSSCFGG